MAFKEMFLPFLANLNLAIIDLVMLEIIMIFIFTVDKGGNVKYTLDRLFGISKSKATETYVFSLIAIGVLYFFVSNYFQETVMAFLINTFEFYLILTFIVLLSFSIFWISKFIIGRKFTFRLCWIPLLVSIGIAVLLSLILFIKYSN